MRETIAFAVFTAIMLVSHEGPPVAAPRDGIIRRFEL